MFWKDEYQAKEIIVGIDFDGVLAQGLKIKIKYAKEWFGIDLTKDQTKEKSFNKLMESMSKNIDYRSLMDPLNEKHIMEYEIPPYCLEVLRKLYLENFRFVVITSRNSHDHPFAQMFLKKYFSEVIRYTHNTRNQPKDEFVRRLRVRAYIDDDLKKLVEIEKTPAQLIYYRQPENEHINLPLIRHKRIHEVRNWKQVYDILHRIKDIHEAVCWRYGIENNSFHIKEIDGYCRRLSEQELYHLVEDCNKIKK